MSRHSLAATILLMPLAPALAKDDLPLEKHVFEAGGEKLPYRLLKPAKVEDGHKYPLVIFLHGAGERGSDNEKQLIHGVSQFAANRDEYPCFLIAPQCPDGKKWVEVDWSADSHTMPKEPGEVGRLTLGLIEQSIKELTVDPKRVYLTGLSMGGYGTWDLLARRPDLFAAAAPVCGGADEATAPKIKDIPVWAFHGARDTAVKPARSRNMIAALKKAGGSPKYTEYPDVGHNSWEPAYKDPELFKWLFAQKKD
jgi:predicted peptidase